MRRPRLTDAGPPPRLRGWAALIVAALGGLLLDVASPGLAWWPAMFAGVVLVCTAVWQQRAGVGAAAGAVAGAAFWLPHISWLTLYLGPVPWLGLGGAMIAWFALFGLLAAVATRGLSGLIVRPRSLAAAQAIAIAGLWVAREQVQSTWPYGGFAWGRLAHTQAESPLAQSVSWTGFAGLSGLLALACAVPVAVAFAQRAAGAEARSGMLQTCGVAVASILALVLVSIVPAAPLPQTGTLRVAAVQGDADAGIFDDRESGDVIRDHLRATDELLDRLEADGDAVDVIVWPENSAEFDLPGSPLNGYRLSALSARAGAPIVAGSVLRNPDGTYTNSAVVWTEDGPTAERYDKRRPVPFAEYMPNRSFFHALAPDLVDLVQLEYEFGTLPAAFDVGAAGASESPAGESGSSAEGSTSDAVRAGIAICFDIIFDEHAVAMQRDGAEVVFAPTNNADFGRTDESAQQLAIARLRAIEMGRALVNISTVGTSAIVAPDGRDLDRLVPFTADAMVADVPLVQGATPALRFGAWIAGAWIVLGLGGAAAGACGLLRNRRR